MKDFELNPLQYLTLVEENFQFQSSRVISDHFSFLLIRNSISKLNFVTDKLTEMHQQKMEKKTQLSIF